MHYYPYFSLKLFHSYYQQQICPDFTIEPTPVCQRFLQGHRWVLKPSANGLQLLVPLENAQEPMISLAEAATFTFLLRLKTPAFIAFTQLDPAYQASRSLYTFSNETLTGVDASELTSALVQRDSLTQPNADPSSLEARCAAVIATLRPAQRRSVFGLIEIHINDSLPQAFSQSREFTLTFAAKQQLWTYYLVADKGTAAEAFSIQDKDANIRFSQAALDPRDRVLTAIQTRFPGSQPIRLQSVAPVPCREVGKPNLQLFKAGHTKPWIPHLPNPPNQQGTQVINLLEDV
ncbi:MAG: hypothetical protein F6J95_016295 [Leptolyngbya sp. SIO1E4]|nr:hypothetical protein [Leptolyngbya sp. SIO1E4]